MELEQREFFEEQINKYKEIRPLYKQFSKILRKVLNNLVKGCSSEFIIEERVKSISGFANKIFNREEMYTNPILEIRDLCGVRLILPNISEMNAVCEVIRDNFIVDITESTDIIGPSTSMDILEHYRSYIVQLIPGLNLYERLDLKIPNEILKLKAEIQVRTYLSQGWAANQDQIFKKFEFKVPRAYEQELSRVKSLLTIEDNALDNIMKKMQDYKSIYGAYMSREKILSEIERLEMVYEADKDNYEIGHRIAKLAMTINNMDKSIEILNEILNSSKFIQAPAVEIANVLRDLGTSNHIKYKKDPSGASFLKGQSYLKDAVQRNPLDYDAWASLGGTYKDQKNYDKALECYKQALKVNPGDPYPLGNYLVLNIQQTGNLLHIGKNHDMIEKAIEKRLRQIEVMVDIPWAYFDVGLFNLFLGNLHLALDHYLKGIRFSPNIWMIETTLNTLNNLMIVQNKLEGIKIVKQLLLLGIYFHPNLEEKTDKLIEETILKLDADFDQKEKDFGDSIVIIAGGTDERIEKSLDAIKNNLIETFNNFKCTIISGGTKSGISKIVGDIQKKFPNNIRTVGYIPSHIPAHVELDKRYSAIHITEGKDFSILEPLHYWYDLMKLGIEPSKIKLIGINGGNIAAFEFHAAIVFGAQVGIMKNSGRAASELINDPSWEEPTGPEYGDKPKKFIKILKNSTEDIYNFLTKPFIIDPDIDNIQKLLIQHRESGTGMYELNFTSEEIDNSIFSGFLTALDIIASQELKVGEIISIKFSEGHLTGGFFTNKEFKVVFLLNETPTPSLEDKVTNYIKDVELRLGEHLHKLQQSCRAYLGGKEMNAILSNIFGSEILKFVDTKLEQKSSEILQVPE